LLISNPQNLRNLESHLLSAQEAITAAYFQNMHPNPCKVAKEGYFGSKFITVCVSGNEQNQIHLDGYQISDQGMGLVKYECIVPTKDVPQLAYVLESTTQKYVPDVFYRYFVF
jgi:nuclear protein localization family protein 4